MKSETLDDFSVRLHEPMLRCLDGSDLTAEDFNRWAQQLFELQYAQNPAYRTVCAYKGVSPEKVQHWTEIPAAPAAAFKDLELSCIPEGERTAVFLSSGTTGQRPSRHFHHERSLELYETSLLSWFGRHFPEAGSAEVAFTSNCILKGSQTKLPLVSETALSGSTSFSCTVALTPPPGEAPHSSLVHMFDTLRRSFASSCFTFSGRAATDGSWTLNVAATLEFLRTAIDAGGPVLMLGTAFSYVHFLDWLAEQGQVLELPPGTRLLETGGYKGRSRALPKQQLHELMSTRLGVPAGQIVCEYGMSELSSQAYDRVAGPAAPGPPTGIGATGVSQGAPLFGFPPWVRHQIISPETGHEAAEGESGLLRIFDLANVYSVMAIQTEDLAIRRGAGFELLGRAIPAEPRGCSLMAS